MQTIKKRVLTALLAVMTATTMFIAVPIAAFAANPPSDTIDYTQETLTGLVPGGYYLITGDVTDEVQADASGSISLTNYIKDTVAVVFDIEQTDSTFGSGTFDAGGPTTITLPERGVAPVLTSTDETVTGANDGTIEDTTATGDMEYTTNVTNPAGTWDDASGSTTIDNLAPGTYYVRYQAVPDTDFATAFVTVTIAAGSPPPPPANVCKIGSTGYPTLDAALAAVQDGETITLLQNIDYADALIIDNGKDFTLDLAGYKLNIENPAQYYYALLIDDGASSSTIVTVTGGVLTATGDYEGVIVEGTSELKLGTGGVVNATGGYDGVAVYNTAKATVTTATTTGAYSEEGDASTAATAYDSGSEIVVMGDATATGSYSVGVLAISGGKVTVYGNVSASGDNCAGVVSGTQIDGVSITGSQVIVYGDVTVEGTGCIGAWANVGSTARIDGTLTVPQGELYIQVGQTVKASTDFEATTTLAGYNTFTDNTNTVWVKAPVVNPGDNSSGDNTGGSSSGSSSTSKLPATGDVVGLLGGSIIVLSLALGALLLILRKKVYQL